MFWRPFHSVPRADTDGNPETASDPGWTPFLDVNHPEYPSAHAFFTTALATALKKYFGTKHLNWQISSTASPTTRVYTDLDDLFSELQNARIYAGLHYRFSTEAGTKLGRQVCLAWVSTPRVYHWRIAWRCRRAHLSGRVLNSEHPNYPRAGNLERG